MQGPSQQNVDKERLTVDISALRQQYRKLRQRQQQAHIILTCKDTQFTPFWKDCSEGKKDQHIWPLGNVFGIFL